jgi:hypothetical protein
MGKLYPVENKIYWFSEFYMSMPKNLSKKQKILKHSPWIDNDRRTEK